MNKKIEIILLEVTIQILIQRKVKRMIDEICVGDTKLLFHMKGNFKWV